MQAIRFEHSSTFEAPAEALWAFRRRPEALEILSPRWMGLRIADPGRGIADGSVVQLEVGPWPLRQRWHALHTGVEANRSFTDIALRSPFRYWVHHHSFVPVDATTTDVVDEVRAGLKWHPLWAPVGFSMWLGLPFLFAYRERMTRRTLEGVSVQ